MGNADKEADELLDDIAALLTATQQLMERIKTMPVTVHMLDQLKAEFAERQATIMRLLDQSLDQMAAIGVDLLIRGFDEERDDPPRRS